MTVTHTSDWRAYLPQKSHFLHKSNKRPLICDMWEKVTLIYGMTLARLDDFCKENVDRHWLRKEATKKMTFRLTQYLNIICFKRIVSVAQSSQVGFVFMQQLWEISTHWIHGKKYLGHKMRGYRVDNKCKVHFSHSNNLRGGCCCYWYEFGMF